MSRQRISFTLLATACMIGAGAQRAEYFIDTDPGYGRATAITASEWATKSYWLELGDVKAGAHVFYLRCQDEQGRWSPTVSRPLYVQPYQGFWRLEYFFDQNDTGQGKAIQLPRPEFSVGELLASLSTSGLTLGTHTLNVRGMRQDGSWSDIVSQPFLVVEHIGPTVPDAPGNLEYFFDNDPGYGFGQSVKVSTGENRVVLNISELNAGAHILYMRSHDDDGRWSPTVSRPLYVCRNMDITALEYYFDDDDPGYGLAYQVAIPKSHGSVIAFEGNIEGLSSGRHQLNVRAKNSWGMWTMVSSESFTISGKTDIREVAADFGFDVRSRDGFCTITQHEGCQRGDCRVEIVDMSGCVVSYTIWKASVSNIQLPLQGITGVYIIRISDLKDGRYFIRTIMNGK